MSYHDDLSDWGPDGTFHGLGCIIRSGVAIDGDGAHQEEEACDADALKDIPPGTDKPGGPEGVVENSSDA